MKKYRVGIKTADDKDWVYNGLRFETREAAEQYGQDLWSRWTAVTEWEVHEVEEVTRGVV